MRDRRFVGGALALVLVLLASAAPVASAASATPLSSTDSAWGCANTVADHDVPVPPDVLVPAHEPDPNRVRVVLPEGYDEGSEAYPVLLLLHGAGDRHHTWVDNTDVEAHCEDVIVVMPDGGRNAEAGWYSDWVDGSRDWERFHIGVVLPWVDATFRTLGDGHRAVAGLSMGGFGAMSYAARHDDLFQAAASFSGAVDTMYVAPVSGVGFQLAHPQFGTPDERVWGPQHTPEGEAEWRAHNPTDRVHDLDDVALFLATGTGTPGGPAGDDPSNPGGYLVEQAIWQMNQSFVRALDAAGIPHTDDFYLGGLHSWPYWERAIHWALPQLVDVIEDDGSTGPTGPGLGWKARPPSPGPPPGAGTGGAPAP